MSPIILPPGVRPGSLTLSDLRAFVRTRGFDYLTDAQLDALIVPAASELVLEEPWPWRAGVQSGAAPLTIGDLGHVDYVLALDYQNKPLRPLRGSDLADMQRYPAQISGSNYYIVSDQLITAYPVGQQIEVHYYSRYPWRVGGALPADATDTPIGPGTWHELIGDLAVARAHLINKDEEGRKLHLEEYGRRKEQAIYVELSRDGDEPETVGYSEDW